MPILCNNGERVFALMKENPERERGREREREMKNGSRASYFKDMTFVCMGITIKAIKG